MSTDGFENTFVCVCTHTWGWFGTLQQIPLLFRRKVSIKRVLWFWYGAWGRRKRGFCKESFYATSPLQTVFANCGFGVCLFYWFCMKKKPQHLANGMLWNANKMGSETCTVWGEGVNQCWELQTFADWCALTHCEKLEAFPLIVVLSSVCLCSLSVIVFLKKVLLNT